jgi:CubicO group peptidase (beta-lactamase class C family)
MLHISRRTFGRMTFALIGGRLTLHAAPDIDAALGASVQRHGIPACAAMVAGADHTIYHGAFGTRDSESRTPVTTQTIFRIASMTKPVTAVAAMQLVERGKVKLDDPVGRYVPELARLEVLEGFAADGHPILRPAAGPVLLRHLLTHTSGFAYEIWDADLTRYSEYLQKSKQPAPAVTPLKFDPGMRWEYGYSMDWAGRVVEAVSGQTLEAYFQQEILQPLGMKDTSFILAEEKFDRLVGVYQRDEGGLLKERPRKMPKPATTFSGGGGLYSTPEDYVRFMQMFLRGGQGILRGGTVKLMSTNHIGKLSAGKLKSVTPQTSSDMDLHPGHTDGFGYGFLINSESGRLAWAGIDNTFFWIDPKRRLCAVIMMQFLPFCDQQAIGTLQDFDKSVYATV